MTLGFSRRRSPPAGWSCLSSHDACAILLLPAYRNAQHIAERKDHRLGFPNEFQELVTQYAWGSIWTRPGLDRRTRSIITLTALIARGHHEELAMHLRAARTNGLTDDEIKEVILQSAIYCGVPDANTAFRIAQRVLEQDDDGR